MEDAYTNPFNPKATIKYSIKEGETGTLVIYDITGKVVEEKADIPAGDHIFVWEPSDVPVVFISIN